METSQCIKTCTAMTQKQLTDTFDLTEQWRRDWWSAAVVNHKFVKDPEI